MTNIDLLQIGHERHGDARMMVKINVSDSPHVELPSAHRHRFYAVYWIHEGRGVHSIDFCDYEIMPDRVFFVRPDQVHFMQVRDAARYSAIQFTEEYFQLCAKIDNLNPSTFIDLVDDSAVITRTLSGSEALLLPRLSKKSSWLVAANCSVMAVLIVPVPPMNRIFRILVIFK